MQAALLDVNVLIALIDPGHQFHGLAYTWFERNRRHGWATCPITENGCLRIMSNPGYPFPGLTPSRVREVLTKLVELDGHVFWPASPSLLDAARFDLAAVRPKELTDLYLLGIATAFGGRLATFDRSIRWNLVTGSAADSIEVLS